MEIDDDAKEIVREIGSAINESVENSTKVAEAIERLREAGYGMGLTVRLGGGGGGACGRGVMKWSVRCGARSGCGLMPATKTPTAKPQTSISQKKIYRCSSV